MLGVTPPTRRIRARASEPEANLNRTVRLAAVLSLAGCSPATRLAMEPSRLPPPPPNYRQQIAKWAKGFFVEYSSLRSVLISNPVPLDTPSGDVWLVCVQIDA